MIDPYKELYHYELFVQYHEMKERALRLMQEDPEGFMHREEVKFFARVRRSMDACLSDPAHEDYRCGTTLAKQVYQGKPLGKGYSHWRRIKHGMPQRYRLFFQFSSEARELIFAWLNDQTTLRKDGSKTDAYAVFARLVASGKIPNPFDELRKESKPA